MSEVIYRHWRPGDDDGVMRVLGPQGWCTPERYAVKFEDAGLRPTDVLIAERAGQIVGHLMLPHRRLRFDAATVPFGGVGMVVVDPATRGLGIGARLLDAAMAHHRAAGNALAGLFTLPTLLPAYAMYRRRGFVPVCHRLTLRLPVSALPPAGTLAARPATEADRPGLTRLLDAWASEHRCVSVEAAAGPLTGQWVVHQPDGDIVGRLDLADPPGQPPIRLLLAAPSVPIAAVLATVPAALPAAVAGDTITLRANRETRVYAELAPLVSAEEVDGGVLMLAPLHLARLLAGLAVEIAGHLRQNGAGPVQASLALDGPAVRLTWDGRLLTLDDPAPTDPPPVALTTDVLALGLSGQPTPPPMPTLAPLWAALFPPRRAELRLIDCW